MGEQQGPCKKPGHELPAANPSASQTSPSKDFADWVVPWIAIDAMLFLPYNPHLNNVFSPVDGANTNIRPIDHHAGERQFRTGEDGGNPIQYQSKHWNY